MTVLSTLLMAKLVALIPARLIEEQLKRPFSVEGNRSDADNFQKYEKRLSE
jgi:hypothetical protein